MRIEREELLRLDSSLGRHWLETDGLGGFASSTLLHCATSRYHGLLVVPLGEDRRRRVLLSRFEETLVAEGREFPISVARYGGGLHPGGWHWLASMQLAPFPAWTYGIGDVEVRREFLLVRDAQVALVRWRLSGAPRAFELHLRPFLPFRDADALSFENARLDRGVRPLLPEEGGSMLRGIACRPYAALPEISITSSLPAQFAGEAHWYRGVEFSDDLARGYGGHEDQWSPGRLTIRLPPGGEVVVAASTGEPVADPLSLWRAESLRRRGATSPASGMDAALARASDAFLYRAQGGRLGVIAGYPWFGEWGRDTLIALPGLLLPRGRVEECGDALAGLVPFLRDGRLPNLVGPTPAASVYAAADPALWFARAVRMWETAGGDPERLADEIYPAMLEIVRAHRDAAGGDVRLDESGLLRASSGEAAATWMDARIGGVPVTPRDGCAVEVNALWCFLLTYVARVARRLRRGREAREAASLERKARESFLARFWLEDEDRLADRWTDSGPDRSVRPNMVIAAGLEFSPLTREQRAGVVAVARSELLTPRGLRTLSPRDPAYQGRYEGDLRARDHAYHQGTVWPWLLGSYADAHLRAHGRGRASRAHVLELVEGFEPHLAEHALGQVSEVFDGDPPHRAGGAWAQAWSVAELARARALAAAPS